MSAKVCESAACFTVAGVIHRVDTSARELTLFVEGAPLDLVVPPDCLIRLNGEGVKLRLLQPGDRAEVGYSYVGSTAFAHSVKVNWLLKVAVAAALAAQA